MVGRVRSSPWIETGVPYFTVLVLAVWKGFSAAIWEKETAERDFGCQRCALYYLFFADDLILFGHASSRDCEAMKDIKAHYAKTSGQVINFSKSLILFSPKVDIGRRMEIQNSLGLSGDNQSQDNYLGLPSFVGKNKRSTFNGIKERVAKRLWAWKGKLFSMGGKEVLIKAVAQATATYTMSVFKLPVTLCDDLQAMVAMSWWGGGSENRKIHCSVGINYAGPNLKVGWVLGMLPRLIRHSWLNRDGD